MKKGQITHLVSVGLLTVSLLGSGNAAYADEIVVSGNGASSDNQVQATSTNSTTVTQENNSQITNNVSSDANTGGNEVSGNTGDNTQIQTGNVTTDTTVVNENINTNAAQVGSNSSPVNAAIANNGAGSANTVNSNTNNSTTVTQTNNAVITNNIITNANTGNNTANYNNGNTVIKTGDIYASHNIQNKNINNSKAKIDGNSCNNECIQQTINLWIKNNGAGSDNFINVTFNNETNDVSYNWADIINSSIMNLNTGDNTAKFNNGDVLIKTGDIFAITNIINKDINSNHVEISCNCVKKEVPVTPITHVKPAPNNVTSSGGGGGSSSSAPSVLGAAIGGVLPVTGGNNLMFWMTLAALIMFFSGWYLRFRSGCAPGFVRV